MLKKSGFWLISVISFFPTKKVGIPMGLIISVIGIISVISVYAQEQITITTYYPSPYGSYNDLTVAGRQAIGDVNGDGQVNSSDMAVDGLGAPIPGSLTVAGRVGIGTYSPRRSLEVDGTGIVVGKIQNLSGGLAIGTAVSVNPDDVTFWAGNDTFTGTPTMILKEGGNVGIGRIPTANRLEVEGNASKTAAGDWLANSDARIKTDIRDLENAIDIINKLHPVQFRYKEEYRAKHKSIEDRNYYNFIAQEFQEVFPGSVSDDGAGYLQIDTHNVKIYLVAAVKELSKITKIQQQKIDSLEEGITKLKAQLDVR